MKSKKEKYCLNPSCKKELIHTEGRRPKKYCSPACRISHHLSQKKAPKYVQLETHNKVKKQLDELLFKSMDKSLTPDLKTNSGLITEFKGVVPQDVYDSEKQLNIKDEHPMYDVPSEENKIKLTRIMEIEKELKNPPKNPTIGIKTWTKVREAELKSLKSQIQTPNPIAPCT